MSEKEIEKIKNKVKMAVDLFMENDIDLLEIGNGVHEQSISHRIAVYLECLFRGFHVDCEYNKHGDNLKGIKNVENTMGEERKECVCTSCKKWIKNHPDSEKIKEKIEIRPDIIIHKERGNKDSGNILAIEIKKEKKCLFDQAKLNALVDNSGDYKYNLGAFIYFPENKPEVEWFPKEILKNITNGDKETIKLLSEIKK